MKWQVKSPILSKHPLPNMCKAYAKNKIYLYVNFPWDNEWKISKVVKSTHDFFPAVADPNILNVTPLAYQKL